MDNPNMSPVGEVNDPLPDVAPVVPPARREVVPEARTEATPLSSAKTPGPDQIDQAKTVRAKDMGWRDKDDWKGDSENWTPRDVFLATQPLYQRMDGMNKAIHRRDRDLADVTRRNSELMKHLAEQQVTDLKVSRKAAMEEDDIDKAETYTDKIAEIKAQQKFDEAQAQQQANTPAPNPRVDKFIEDNRSWYNTDKKMTAFTNAMSQSLVDQHGGWNDSIMDDLETEVKRAFPEKFKNQRREQPSQVDPGRNRSSQGKHKYSANDLDDAAHKVMRTLVASGTLTERQYIDSVEAEGYFKP